MHGEEKSLSGQRFSKDHRWKIAQNSFSNVLGLENLKKKTQQALLLSRNSSIFSCQTCPGHPVEIDGIMDSIKLPAENKFSVHFVSYANNSTEFTSRKTTDMC